MYWVFQELFKVRNKIEKNEKHSENISLDAFLVQKTEENVMNKEEFLNYIIDFAVDTLWDDLKRREQLRALFTSWCFIFGIDADTKEYLIFSSICSNDVRIKCVWGKTELNKLQREWKGRDD